MMPSPKKPAMKTKHPEKRSKPDSSPNPTEAEAECSTTQLERLFANLSSQINGKMDEMNQNLASLREEITGEMAKLKQVVEEFKEEKQQMVLKQSALESRIEQLERAAKRNKIVISGLDRKGVAPVEAVNNLLSEQLKVTARVKDAFEVKKKSGKSIIVASFNAFEDKIETMKEKSKLPKDIYINNDLTAREQFLNYKAREFLKSLNTENRPVKIRTGLVHVGNTTYAWDEQAQSYAEQKN